MERDAGTHKQNYSTDVITNYVHSSISAVRSCCLSEWPCVGMLGNDPEGGVFVGWMQGGLAGGGAVLRAVYLDSYHPCLHFLNLVRASVFNTLRHNVKAGD